jgi:subtilase-type serine protease
VYAGAPVESFVSYGQYVDPWIANGGIGFAYQASDALEITARYDAQTRSRFSNQTASVKALWKF